jgi:hypothetical protein
MKKTNFLQILLSVLLVLVSLSVAKAQTYNSNADGYNGGYGQVY